MFDPRRVLAVLLARGGSRGIPGKNLRPLAGVSLLGHAIDRLREVPSVARVVVSTDTHEIASLALAHGADVPFLRPVELARDETPALAALTHAVRFLVDEGEQAGVVLLHQATSPCCSAAQIEEALTHFLASDAACLRSVTAVREHPQWMGRIENGRLEFLTPPDQRATRRQDLPPLVRLNGAINIYRSERLLAGDPEAGPPLAYLMDARSSIDIDTPEDWQRAEQVLKAVETGA